MIDERHNIIASGSFTWENQLINGIWTYSLDLAKQGLQHCYKELKEDYQGKHHEKLSHIDAIGISGMMHGYLVFDKNGKQIKEFRTWRNTITQEASDILTKEFQFHVPQRWSVSHVYQAILNNEEGVKDIDFATTLAGYFHYLLTGYKVVGVGEASGMFPIDTKKCAFDEKMLQKFNILIENEVPWKLEDIFPKVLKAGDFAGELTAEGSLLMDPSGDLEAGSIFCAPEGDMGTGMVCTNSILPGTGNSSIGTSSNLTIVIGKDINVYPEIDVITTPTGVSAALVHVNNGTSEINAWERLFKEVAQHFNEAVHDGDVYLMMFNAALNGDKESKGIYPIDYLSGEPVAKVNEGKLLLIREPDAKMDLANFMRSHIYSLLGTIRLGTDILTKGEGVKIHKIVGHGGFFKTPSVGELMLSASLNCPVVTLASAGEGGPYGEALLAAYLFNKEKDESLEEYLSNKVFAGQGQNEYMASKEDVDGFNAFLANYEKALKIEKETIKVFKKEVDVDQLKQDVYDANMRLYREGLTTLTWGNASAIDRKKGIVVIKPSGVPYEAMKPSDMVVVDLEGKVVDGTLNPSTDTPAHLELYKRFPHIGGVVHSHSTYATAWAQAKKDIPMFGTTHADTFLGDVPCTRELSKEEIESDYELNTGKVIVETFKDKDPEAIPAAIVANHGPFAWGESANEAVNHAVILEKVAEMALLTKAIDENADTVSKDLLNKHYQRKHGKNAYYGQGGK